MESRDVARPPPHSPWHSPVPYLFGGLAAMLGLIAFALLILACSYWKLSDYLDASQQDSGEVDIEAGGGLSGEGELNKPKNAEVEEKILVIMAGEVKPTFLATPFVSSRSFSLGDNHHASAPQNTSEVGSEIHVIKQQPGNSHHHHHDQHDEQN